MMVFVHAARKKKKKTTRTHTHSNTQTYTHLKIWIKTAGAIIVWQPAHRISLQAHKVK